MKCKQQATEQKKKIYIKELLETAADKLEDKYHMKAYLQISADKSRERKKTKQVSTVQCAY